MFKTRLEAVSDGIFAIVMTLLVIEIKVPESEELIAHYSEAKLWDGIAHLTPLFLAFFLSFSVLANYWVTHNFLVTLMAKNANRQIVYLNFLFFAFVSLIPFSSHLLGAYPNSRVAVSVYSLNVLIIAIMSFVIREYILRSEKISNRGYEELNITTKDRLYGSARILISVITAVLAIGVSYFSTSAAIVLLVIPTVLGIIPGALGFVMAVTGLDKFAKEIADV